VSYPVARRLWADADLVFGIGTRLYQQQSQWGLDSGLRVLRLDIDPEEPGRYENFSWVHWLQLLRHLSS
jgi:acetolactate synthase I/II/III large subunit